MDEKLIKKEPLGNGFYINVTKRHTFGTDAVLLADFAAARNNDRMADLGTGCGIIPFLMLRDSRLSKAVGVDISAEAAQLCERTSLEQNTERFSVINSDIKELKGKIPFGSFTLVTCNPPYKAPNAGIKNSDSIQAAARHETQATLEDFISVGSRLLQTSGRFCICQRPERLAELMRLLSEYKTEPKRLRLVCKRRGCEPWLVMVEGRKCGNTGLRIAPTLYIEEDGGLSDEMIRIYGPYKAAYLE